MAQEITSKDHMNFGEALERLSEAEEPRRDDLASKNNSASISWDLGIGFPKAAQFARFGWDEKKEDIQKYFSIVQNLVQDKVDVFFDVAGEAVDVGAYLAGEPECMIAYNVPEVKSVNIVVNLSAASMVDAKILLNRGIAVASLVYALQASSVGVSLSIGEWVTSSTGYAGMHETKVKINDYSEYIDPGRLAFWLAHPAALRRCIFRFQEQLDKRIRDKFGFYEDSGYGQPSDPPSSRFKGEDQAVYIPYPNRENLEPYTTLEKAFETVRKIAADQGINLQMR